MVQNNVHFLVREILIYNIFLFNNDQYRLYFYWTPQDFLIVREFNLENSVLILMISWAKL